jgi:hypothetical protein
MRNRDMFHAHSEYHQLRRDIRVCFINPFQVGRCDPQGAKARIFLGLNGTAEQAAEK